MRLIALSTVLAVSACSSNYIPQQRGRIAVIMKSGQQAYVRDGRVIEHGLFGGGLEDAVAGHPAATVAANEYQDRIKWGLLGMLGGMVGMIGGMAYAISEADHNPETGNDELSSGSQTGLLISLGGAVVMLIGAGYLATAEPYRWDAINIFNDTPPPPVQMPYGPGYAPSASVGAKQESLNMRD